MPMTGLTPSFGRYLNCFAHAMAREYRLSPRRRRRLYAKLHALAESSVATGSWPELSDALDQLDRRQLDGEGRKALRVLREHGESLAQEMSGADIRLSRRRRETFTDDPEVLRNVVAPLVSVAEIVSESAMMDELAAAIKALPYRPRRALELHLSGCLASEIAEALSCCRSTVYKLLEKAVETLADQVNRPE
jgi:DNA-directed RNA polymerase specialized sigma subunit